MTSSELLKRHRIPSYRKTGKPRLKPLRHVRANELQPRAAILDARQVYLSLVRPELEAVIRRLVRAHGLRNDDNDFRSRSTASLRLLAGRMKVHAARQQSKLLGITIPSSKALDKLAERFAEQGLKRVTSVVGAAIESMEWFAEQSFEAIEVAGGILEGLSALLEKTLVNTSVFASVDVVESQSDAAQTIQESVGVEEYIWLTMRDDLVRPRHAELDGTRQSWDEPPVVNDRGERMHPGEDFNFFPCRCIALPVAPGSG